MKILKYSLFKLDTVLALLLLLSTFSFAQNYSLSGRAVEQYTQNPLAGIEVTLTDVIDSSYTMMAATDANGEYEVSLTLVTIDELLKPEGFGLGRNYPQPFNPSTTIPFSVIEQGDYTLQAFDLLGREVAKIEQSLDPASYSVRFQGATAGLYFIRLSGAGYHDVIKVTALDGNRITRFFKGGSNLTHDSGTLAKVAENERTFRISVYSDTIVGFSGDYVLNEGANPFDLNLELSDYDPFFVTDIFGMGTDEDTDMWTVFGEIFGYYGQDELQYEVLNLTNATSIVSGEHVGFFPDPNWFGVIEDVVIRCSDNTGYAESNAFDIVIDPVNDFPIFSGAIPDVDLSWSDTLVIDPYLYFSDVEGDSMLFEMEGVEPLNLEMGESSLFRIFPDPGWTGSAQLRLIAQDIYQEQPSYSNHFSINILTGNFAPEFQTQYPDTSIYLEETLVLALDCVDLDGDSLIYSLNQPDSIWHIEQDSLFITPPDTGYYELSIVASDPSGLADTLSVELYVHPWETWKHITGTIREIYTLEGMEGLTVQLLDSATIYEMYDPFGRLFVTEQLPELVNILAEAQTDAQGNYRFPNREPGRYVVNIIHPDTSIYFAKKGMILPVSQRIGVADSLANGNNYVMIPKDLQVPGTTSETVRINLLQLYEGRMTSGHMNNLLLNYQSNGKTNAHEMAGRPMQVYLGNFSAADSLEFLQYLAEGDSLFGKEGTIVLGRQTYWANDLDWDERLTYHPITNNFPERTGWNIYANMGENQTYPLTAQQPNIYYFAGGTVNLVGNGMNRLAVLKETQARMRGWGDVPESSRPSLMNLNGNEPTVLDRGLENVHSLFAIRIIEGYETGHRTDYRIE